jgi:hypothetical protein
MIVAALAVTPVTLGHTWIEQMRNVNDKGKYVGEWGYPRGMIAKTDPGYNGDLSMVYLMPGASDPGNPFITEDTLLCHKAQRQQKPATDKYPRLQATPGGYIAMRYMENGHVTLPANQKGKPEKGGTVFVYGTTEPKEDEKLATVLRWTQDGKGGDARGVLLSMNDYDDERCYEKNDTPVSVERVKATPNYAMGQADEGAGTMPLFCETNVQLPKTAAMGKPYTLYWVWQWNTAPGIDPGLPKGKDEYYSTCIDVDVASASVALAADAKPKFALGQQDAMSVAVADFASRTAIMTDALKGEVGPIFSGNKTSAPSAPGGAPTQKPTAPAPSGQPPAAPSQAPKPSAPSASGEPEIPTITKRPGAGPSSKPGNSGVVTVTDTVLVTVTASASKLPPAAGASKPAASPVKSQAPAPGVTLPASPSAPAGVAPSAGPPSPPSAGPSPAPSAGLPAAPPAGPPSPPPAGKPSAPSAAPPSAPSAGPQAPSGPGASAAPSVGPQAPSGAAPSQLPGFNMRNKNSVKFRGMFT